MSRQKAFTDELWYEKTDTIYTIGLRDEVAAELAHISDLELPKEGEWVEKDSIIGRMETDQGEIDIYSPVDGTIVEVNTVVLDDPSLIIEDPSEGWLFQVESEEEPSEDEEEDSSESYEDEDDFEEDEDLDDDEDFLEEDEEE
jgi:glycine cleavage system H protein